MKTRTDEIIEQEIIEHLIWDDSVNINDVDVNVINGVVRLSGIVPTYTAKIAAENNAYRIAGVVGVDNQLEVEFPVGLTLPSDSEITNMIERKFIWNDQLDATSINVETIDGVVTLTGNVNTYWEKNLAAGIALATSGVLRVENNLVVLIEKSFVDIDIENDIKRAFKRNFLIDADKINVNVNNGVAHLTGAVPSYSMKIEAFDTAMFTAGVVDVINDITVE
ncbi:MAG: BON domain-containing protein [Bacteroidota bacterium]